MDNLIATIPKNSRERIEVALSEFTKDGNTFDMISARVHYDDGSGQYKPGRNGLNVQVKATAGAGRGAQPSRGQGARGRADPGR